MKHRIAYSLRVARQTLAAWRWHARYQGAIPATLHVLRVLRTRWLMIVGVEPWREL